MIVPREALLLRIVCVLVALLTCSGSARSDPAAQKQTGQAKRIEVTGCLYVAHDKSGKDEFSFFSREPATLRSNQLDWRLTGNIAALPKHSFFVPMRIRGIEKSPGVVEVIQAKRLEPVATMNKSLDDGSTWHSETNEVYGVRFA